MRFLRYTISLAVLCLSGNAVAQSILELPPVDASQELAKRASIEKDFDSAPLRFALPVDLEISPKTHGDWIDSPSRREWRLRVRSSGATDLNFGFGRFRIPEGATLELISLSAKKPMRYGPYGSEDATDGKFWSPPLPGGEAEIVLRIPHGATGAFDVELSRVGTGFRDIYRIDGGPGLSKQGPCNIDVVCPEGDGWRDEIRSVAAYTVDGIDTCTGTMVMDAAQSFTPYFITAWHCGVRDNNASSVVTIWNYESPNCGDLGNGSRMDTVSGASFVAGRGDVDSTLLELSSSPPASYDVYWAGWDRTDAIPNGSVGIHHPGVDEKAISFNDDALTKTNSCIIGGTSDTHWEVDNWEQGTTEPGSSGSALFDPTNKRLIGFLSGGRAACGNTLEDCYGRLDVAWSGGADDSERFGPWLDPNDTGTSSVAGSDPVGFSVNATPPVAAVCAGQTVDFDVDVTASGGFSDNVTLSVDNRPPGTSTTFTVNPVTPPGMSVLTIGNTSGLASGAYPFSLVGTANATMTSAPLTLNVSEGPPSSPTLSMPGDGAVGVLTEPTLTWTASGSGADSYDVQVAADAAFSNIVDAANVTDTSYTVATTLSPDTTYYWRVRAVNGCGVSPYTAARSFTTGGDICSSPGVAIPDNNASGVSDSIEISSAEQVQSLRVSLQVTHTWVGDLIATLRHEDTGTDVVLMDRPGSPAAQNGCNEENVDVTFDDSATDPVEDACEIDPAIAGTLRPEEPLSGFDGQNLAGTWTLTLSDNAGADTGTLDTWCVIPETAPLPDMIFANGFE